MRTFRNAVRLLLAILLSGYLGLLALLHFDPLQRQLTSWLSELLSDTLKTEVLIGEVEVGLFNRVVLHDVCIKDLRKRDLLKAQSLAAKIQLAPLLKGIVSLRTVSLIDANIVLYQEEKGKTPNYQFLLDAFSNKEKSETSSLDLRVNSFILRRCRLHYDKYYLPKTPRQFNLAHLQFSSIDANASLKVLTTDSLNVRLRSLSFREESGLSLNSLTVKLVGNRHQTVAEDLKLCLPNSSLSQERIVFNYDLSDIPKTFSVLGHLRQARIATADLAPLFPQFRKWQHSFIVSTTYRYAHQRLSLMHFDVRESNENFSLQTALTVFFRSRKTTRLSFSALDLITEASFISESTQTLIQKKLPPFVTTLKTIRLKGYGELDLGGRNLLVANLQTAAGEVDINAVSEEHKVSGSVVAKNINFAAILNNNELPQRANFNLRVNNLSLLPSTLIGDVHVQVASADLKGYTYENLEARVCADGRKLKITTTSKDPHLTFSADGVATLHGQQLRNLLLSMNVDRLVPMALGWTKHFGTSNITFRTEMKLPELSLENPLGEIFLSNFLMSEGEEEYRLEKLHFALTGSKERQHLELQSDFAEANLEGQLSLRYIKIATCAFLQRLLPDVFPMRTIPKGYVYKDKWKFALRVFRDDFFRQILHLPVQLEGTLSAEGFLSTNEDSTNLQITCAGFSYGNNHFYAPHLRVAGQGEKHRLEAQTQTKVGGKNVQLHLIAQTDSGRLRTNLIWNDIKESLYTGLLLAETYSGHIAEGEQRTITKLYPSQLRVRDSIWTIESGTFSLRGKSFYVDNFRLACKDHSLALHGSVSPNGGDSLEAHLQKMDIDYILSLVNFHTLRFQGLATGKAILTLPEGKPNVVAQLSVDSLYMNEGLLGHTILNGGYDSKTQSIFLDADITEGTVAHATVRGYVSPAHKRLDLAIENDRLRADFLERYINSIVTKLDTRTTGKFRVTGTFDDLALSGIQDFSGRGHVNALDVDYEVTKGHVEVTPKRISFTDVVVKDKRGGQGMLQGIVRHDYLRDMHYSFEANVNNLYIYNQPDIPELSYFSQVYGTGHVEMQGRPGLFSSNISIRPERQSYITYKSSSTGGETPVPFLTFRDRDSVELAQELKQTFLQDSVTQLPLAIASSTSNNTATDIRLNFQIDVTPDAELRVIMDQKTNDNIVLRGEGGLHATYYNKGDLQVYGTYNVSGGIYRMTIQDFLRKEFVFTGGTITFAGEPFQAGLSLQALYTVPSASLAGLYSGVGLSENSVKVNCLLNIGGRVSSPQVSFDLDLPTADNEVKQLVRNVINTQNDMNMQVLYLLGFGRFYSYNPSTVVPGAGESQSMVAMKSFLSTTITSQLNEILSNAMGVSNWSFGTNIATGDIGWSDVEVEGVLHGSFLKNRLQLNGTLGYRDRAFSTRTSNFVGEFDFRYLLSPKGSVSLKAYSTTNERYFTRSSLTTQGLGIMFRKDFTNLFDLFRRKRKSLKK